MDTETDKHKEKSPSKDKGRGWGDVAEAKEHPTLTANHRKLGERQGTDSPLEPSEITNPADTLISDF